MYRKPDTASAKLKSVALTSMLVLLAVVGPIVAYAGVSIIWPVSEKTVDVNTTPPISFSAGTDHSQANSLGFAGAFTADNNGASYQLAVSGLSGGTVTVDELVQIDRTTAITEYKLEVATALSGTISPSTLKVRLWTGASAPSADGDAQVCAVLDLLAAGGTESATACTGATVKMQLIYTLAAGQTTETGTVEIRPSSIVFA